MALLVSFSAARMTELARITMKDIIKDGNKMIISTQIKKGNNICNGKITLLKKNSQICPV
jgi:hypothetical protein